MNLTPDAVRARLDIALALRIEAADRHARADGIERALCSLTETTDGNQAPR